MGHGDIAVFKGQVGHALSKRAETSFERNLLTFGIPIYDIEDADFRKRIMQLKSFGRAASDMESLFIISTELIVLLGIENTQDKPEYNKGNSFFHGQKILKIDMQR